MTTSNTQYKNRQDYKEKRNPTISVSVFNGFKNIFLEDMNHTISSLYLTDLYRILNPTTA